jgi:hypothetical protein
MDELMAPCQSAFIKGRSIHDNFLYVRNIARWFHRNKTPTLLRKLNISEAFDSGAFGLPSRLTAAKRFPDKMAGLDSGHTYIINFQDTTKWNTIRADLHGWGLRQGDPLSPLLFILAVDPLHRLLSKATDLGSLNKVGGWLVRFRVSMYNDDAAVFIKPTKKTLTA